MKKSQIKALPEMCTLLTEAFYGTAIRDLPTSKREVENAMAALVKQMEEDGMTENVRGMLRILAAHVFNTNPPTPKDDIEWLARMATHRDASENRQWLKFLHVSDDSIEATDGSILGRVPNAQGFPAGYYVPFLMERLSGVPEAWRWPDTDRVLRLHRESPTTEPLTKESFTERTSGQVKAWIIQHKGDDVAYNAHYAKLAFSHPSGQPPCETYILEDKRLYLKWPHGVVVTIMPMRF